MAEYIECEFNPCTVCDYKRCSNCILHELAMKHVGHPAADVAPVVHGEWRINSNGDYFCSKCSEQPSGDCFGGCVSHLSNYCPNCGADMRGSNDE